MDSGASPNHTNSRHMEAPPSPCGAASPACLFMRKTGGKNHG